MANALIGLGSNVGDPAAALRTAADAISRIDATQLLKRSKTYASAPAGGPSGQDQYLNAAALVETTKSPHELLRELLGIEHAMGRDRAVRWGRRTIDLDLLIHEDVVMQSPTLTIPHPRMTFRRFVIEPAAEIAPHFLHPLTGSSMGQLLDHLNHAAPCFLIVGRSVDDARRFAVAVSERAIERGGAPLRFAQRGAAVICSYASRTGFEDATTVELDNATPAFIAALIGADAELWSRGPVSQLDGLSRDEAIDEVLAAIDATRPVRAVADP